MWILEDIMQVGYRKPIRIFIWWGLILVVIGCLGCTREKTTPPVETITPSITPRTVTLGDLRPLKEDYPDHVLCNMAGFPDYKTGMQNPWLISGSDLAQWLYLFHGLETLEKSRVQGLVFVCLQDNKGEYLGIEAMQYWRPTEKDLVAFKGMLLRQGTDNRRLYQFGEILAVVWRNNPATDWSVLTQWLEGKLGLVEVTLALPQTTSGDLVNHISSGLTDDYNSLSYPERCTPTSSCGLAGEVEQSCLVCPGGKFMFSKGCLEPPGVTQAGTEQGLCVQSHMLGSGYDDYFNGECMTSTVFCLIPFTGQEVPTISAAVSARLLPIWKEELLARTNMGEDFYQKHIFIQSADARGRWFRVGYYYRVDWLTYLLSDQAALEGTGISAGNGVLPVEGIEKAKPDGTHAPTDDGVPPVEGIDVVAIRKNFDFSLTHPVAKILTQEQVQAKLDGCKSGMTYDLDHNLRVRAGQFVLQAYGEVDRPANRCQIAELDLETGEMMVCQETACVIP